MMKQILGLAIAGALILAAPIAQAAPTSLPASFDDIAVVVHTGDLNLETQMGAKTMLVRLRNAAANICGPAPRPVEMESYDGYKACYDTTLSQAVQNIHASLVSEAYAESLTPPRVLAMAKAAN